MVIPVQLAVMARNETALQGRIPAETVTRKAQKRVAYAVRTANRHRCSGRVDQGVRVILRQGTRQYSDRNLGIRSAPSQCLSRVTCQFSFNGNNSSSCEFLTSCTSLSKTE